METGFEAKVLSMMAKVFPERICGDEEHGCRLAPGQEACFQIAVRCHLPRYSLRDFDVCVSAPEPLCAKVSFVELVPSELSAYPDRNDDNYITTDSGLFPDPLIPLENPLSVPSDKWRAIWISVSLPVGLPAGNYPIRVTFTDQEGAIAGEICYTVAAEAAILPRQKLLFTEWFHCDCIAEAHGVPVFSEEHWRLIGDYMKMAADHGINLILTPVITPPLDTAVGSERPTVQLVDVMKTADGYAFGFDRLDRYVRLAHDCGIEHFEISHLFTQWGAKYAPKVVARVDGEERRIFGWETSATDPAYADFLRAFVPAVIAEFARLGVARDQLWFHVSDEPSQAQLESYGAANAILSPLLSGCHHLDALSDYEFYQRGLVPTPVVATNRIAPFLENRVPGLWCYYCCGQATDVSNRFFSMPLARTRILGVQLYREHIAGFLHWGYNFYNTQLSRRRINPYQVTDGGGAFPSGDSFSVYPYRNTVAPSTRLKVFERGLEDLRLLEALEEKIGREETERLLDRVAGMRITFSDYPRTERFFRDLYEEIFRNL